MKDNHSDSKEKLNNVVLKEDLLFVKTIIEELRLAHQAELAQHLAKAMDNLWSLQLVSIDL